jgi:hypothetical protein
MLPAAKKLLKRTSSPLACLGSVCLATLALAGTASAQTFTYFEETGALHFHLVDHGKAVAIPVDGTGPSYTANFGDSDLENIRAVKQGDVLVEEDTDLFRTVARGSDGSRAFFKGHAHFTVNANGETTAQLDSARLVCT